MPNTRPHRLDKWTIREMLADLELIDGIAADLDTNLKLPRTAVGLKAPARRIRNLLLAASLADVEVEATERAA